MIEKIFRFLRTHAERPWFPAALGFGALIDHFVVFIPVDGLLVSSTLLTPRRWFWLALASAVGSTIGAAMLSYLLATGGEAALAKFLPSLGSAGIWTQSRELFQHYGVYAVALFAASPFAQQPAVIVAALGGTSVPQIALATLVGRTLKSIVYAWVASHAPQYLPKMPSRD